MTTQPDHQAGTDPQGGAPDRDTYAQMLSQIAKRRRPLRARQAGQRSGSARGEVRSSQ